MATPFLRGFSLKSIAPFWGDDTGFDTGRKLPPHLAKYGLLLLVLNEIRGVIAAGAVVREMLV